jgi:C4-type Zn-finger protein
MSKIRCPNCGNENAELKSSWYYPYQDKPYKGQSINCSKCGYIKKY